MGTVTLGDIFQARLYKLFGDIDIIRTYIYNVIF